MDQYTYIVKNSLKLCFQSMTLFNVRRRWADEDEDEDSDDDDDEDDDDGDGRRPNDLSDSDEEEYDHPLHSNVQRFDEIFVSD